MHHSTAHADPAVAGHLPGYRRSGCHADADIHLGNSAFLPTVADTNWEIKAIADGDGDSKADLFWRNKVTGQNIMWVMNGTTVASSVFLPTIADLSWRIAVP